MGLLSRKLLSLVRRPPANLDAIADADATCTVVVVPKASSHGLPGLLMKTKLSRRHTTRQTDVASSANATRLVDLPLAALNAVWDQLDTDSKRSARLTSRSFWACTRRLAVKLADFPSLASFPALNELHLQLEGVADEGALAALVGGSRGHMRHLHKLSVAGAFHGDAFRTLAHLLVATPSLAVLHLPDHSFSSRRNQRALAGVLDALPWLVELDLGSARIDFGAALSTGVTRRIGQLRGLRHLACNASQLSDAEAATMLRPLVRLQSLRLAIADADSSGGMQQCGAAIGQLTRLTQLELISQSLEDTGAGVMLAGLADCLQELTLGSCSQLTADLMPQVAQCSHLRMLSVPFTLEAPALRLLSRLPALNDLLTARRVALDPLRHDRPLHSVTKLVAASVTTSGQPLAAAFPALECLHLLRCGDAGVAAVAGCSALTTLLIAEARHMSDDGFAALRGIIAAGLSSLSLEDAPRISDAAFQRVFDRPRPQLQQLSLARLPAITDEALLHVTASCRRLTDATLLQCGRLTDKSLCRLAHMERLAVVQIAACNQLTATGVVAVAAAPAMQRLVINDCPCVLHNGCHDHRAAVQVEVDGIVL